MRGRIRFIVIGSDSGKKKLSFGSSTLFFTERYYFCSHFIWHSYKISSNCSLFLCLSSRRCLLSSRLGKASSCQGRSAEDTDAAPSEDTEEEEEGWLRLAGTYSGRATSKPALDNRKCAKSFVMKLCEYLPVF